MAGSSTVVDLLIKAKDLASAPIRGIVASIKFLDSEISVVAGKIRDAFSGLFGGGLDGAIEFEAQLSKVAAKGGFTAAEMAKLKRAATDIGAQFGATGTEAAQGMEALAASGLNATQVVQALPPVLALAKAEGLSMDAAAEKLSDSLATMGLGFDQAGRLANVLAKGANISTTSASALAEALATGGGIARDFGLSLEQTVGILAAFANNGIKASAGGTALQAILTQLINPSSQASKALSALGIETRDFGEVIGALKAKGEAGNAAILAFGETAGPGLRAAIKTGQQGLDDLTGSLKDNDDAAIKAASGISGNLKGALSDLTAAWSNIKTALFDPVLEPLAQQARELADTLNIQLASGALKPVQEAIRSFATNGAQAARDFVAGFDFKAARQSLQDFATGAKSSFDGIKDAGTAAASVVQIAWNGLTAGFKTIGASLLAVASSAVSNIAAIEAAASKIGLGSLERASELKATAIELKAKAEELVQSIAKDGEDIRGAFDRLTSTADGASDGLKKVADAQQGVKDSNPAKAVAEVATSLNEYRRIADLASAAAEKARREYESGKITAADYGRALLAASEAGADLAAATERQAVAAKLHADQLRQQTRDIDVLVSSERAQIEQGREILALYERLKSAAAAHYDALIAQAQAEGRERDARALTVEKLKEQARFQALINEAKLLEASRQREVLAVMQQEAARRQANNETLDAEFKLKLKQQELTVMIAEAEAGTVAAQAKTAQATADLTEKMQLFIAAGYDELEAKRLALLASGQFTEALKIEEQQRKKTAEAAKEQKTATVETADAEKQAADAAKEHAAQLETAGKAVTGTLNGWLDRLDALSPAAVQAFEAQRQFAQSTVETADAGEKADAALDALGQTMTDLGGTGFARQMNETAAAAQEVEATFWGQAAAAERVTAQLETLAATGAGNFGALIESATAAKSTFDLLDQTRLDKLQSAIDAANAKLREMQAEAQSAADRIAEINAEIAAEKGDTATADKLKLQLEQQQSLAEVEAKLAEARRAQNRELIALYEEQKRKLQELYDLKEKNLEQDQRQQNQQTPTGGGTSPATGGSGAAAPAKVYRLDLAGVGGKTLTATTEADPGAFLDALEAAKNRSLA